MHDTMDRVVDGFFIALILLVIGLKLNGTITISWLWLLSPIWIPFSVGLVLAFIVLVCYTITIIINIFKIKENKNERY